MITRKNFKPGETRPGANVNGFFASELPRAEFLEKSFKLIEDLAFEGVEYAGLWAPWPLAEPGKYSEVMQNRMIFEPVFKVEKESERWNYPVNLDFVENELKPILLYMLWCNITPVFNIGGYTRAQQSHPVEWPIRKGSAYSDEHYFSIMRIMHAVSHSLSYDQADSRMNEIIFKASNEPYAFPAPRNCDHKTAVQIIYAMTQFHARFKRDSMKLFNLTDENFAFDVTYGYDRETGKQWPIHNAGMTLGHERKKYDVLKQSIEEIEKIEEKEVKMVDSWSITEFHQCGDDFDIEGRTGDMGPHENFTGVMIPRDPGTGVKHIRKAHIFFVSMDGVKPRLGGHALRTNVSVIAHEAKERNEDRDIVIFFHPVAQYVIPSGDEFTHRWDFNKFDMGYEVVSGVLGLLDAGIGLPNRGKKIEPIEPEKPTPIPPPPGPGVIYDEEKPVKSFTNLEIAGYIGAIIVIAGLAGWFFSSC